jgi:LPXTG-motif cell wall-anchored protein
MVGKNNKQVMKEKQGQKVTTYSIKKLSTGAASVAVSAGLFFSGANAVSAEEQAVSDETDIEISVVTDDETLLAEEPAEVLDELDIDEEQEAETVPDQEETEEESEAAVDELSEEEEANASLKETEEETSKPDEQAAEHETDEEADVVEEPVLETEDFEEGAELEPVEEAATEETATEEADTEETPEADSVEPLAEPTAETEETIDEETEEEVAPGLGTIKDSWERIINENATYRRIASENQNGQQKANIIEFNPQDNEYKIFVTNGEYVIGGDVMSKLIAEAEANGYDVAFAVNGDGYDTSNGVPNGMVISNGIMMNSSNAENRSSLGFLENGEYVYGNTRIDFEVTVDGETLNVDFLNRERKLDEENVYILTEHFAETTQSTQAGVEVILDVITEDYRGIEIGGSFEAVVSQVVHVSNNLNKNQTPIGRNQIVLSAHENSSHYNYLANLAAGDIATINTINNSNVAWEEVDNAIGIFHILMQDGVETSSVTNDTAIHPRTVVGFRPDGSMILMQNEGRQAGYASGLSFRDIVDYLTEQGADTIFNFDGGGSSTLAITMPGEDSAEIVNRPSDGWERANANGLLVLKRTNTEATNEVEQLHLYPQMEKGYTTEVQLLENGVMQFDVAATNDAFDAVDFDLADIEFTTTGGIGEIDENGRLTAASGAHQGQIIATHLPTGVVGTIDVTIVDTITQINVDVSQLSVAPEGERQLNFTALKDGVPVVISPEALDFILSNEDLGYISEDGVFHAYDTQGNGELTIQYKDYALTIPVEVGRLPEVLNDFEGPLEESDWHWRLFNSNGTRGGDGQMSINYDERYVKYGDGSLRIDYDFATNPVTGTVTIEAGPKPGHGVLDGQPEAIGLWIYGDNSGAWIRIQLTGGTYAGDVYVDWDGWKYIETPIPSTAPFPYELQWGIRLLATPNLRVNGKKGTIYVDGLRAVYDYKNDDLIAPALDESYAVTPTDGAGEVSNQPTISMKVYDPEIDDQPYTGINTDRTKLWINGVVHENIQHEVQQDGSVIVSYVPSAITALRPGPTHVRFRVEDNAGNKFFHEWDFVVEGYAVNLTEEKPASEKAYAGSVFDYAIHASDYEDFEDFNLVLEYSPNFVELIDVVTDPRVETVTIDIDEVEGLVHVFMAGMKDIAWDADQPLVNFTFKAENESGGQTGILVREAAVRQTGEVEGTHLALPGYDQEIEIPYTITYDGTTKDYPTTIRVTDLEANPAAGMTVYATVNGETFALPGTTDEKGELQTDALTQYAIGTSIELTTIAPDGGVSNTQVMTVQPSLGDVLPDKVGLTTGFNPATSVGITWETSLEVPAGEIIIADNANMEDAVTVQAAGQTVEYRVGAQNRIAQRWGATLIGLNPGTTYYYQVGEGDNLSEILSFTTADETDNVDIAVIGDLQGAYHNFPGVFEHVEGVYDNYDLIMQVGDFNDNANDYAEWERIMASMDDVLRENIWAVAVGNHDSGNDAQAFTSFFNSPDNGTYETNRNYWFEIGDAAIFVFDTEGYTYDPGFADQKALMAEVFGQTDQTFKMVLMHRPPFPQNYNDGDVRALAPFFEELGVDIVWSGHDHIYSRTSVTSNNNEITHYEPGQSTTYVTMGSSTGSKYYNADQNTRPWTQVVYDEDNPTFGRLTMEGNTLRFIAYAIVDGETVEIDSFEIQKVPVTIESENISGSTVVSAGADATYTVNVPEGYVLNAVFANDTLVPVDENNQFSVRVDDAMTLQAVFEADKAALDHALVVGNTLLDLDGQFTPETTDQLAAAVASGNTVMEDAEATPEQVENAADNIYEAIGQLVSQAGYAEIIEEVEAALEQLNNQIAALTGDNTDLEAQIADLENQLANIEALSDAEIAALQADIAELQAEISEREAELADRDVLVQELEEVIEELGEEVAALKGENTDLVAQVEALQAELANLEELTDAEIADLQEEIAALQAQLAELEAEAEEEEDAQDVLAELEERYQALWSAYEAFVLENQELQEELASLKADIASYADELGESNERITALENRVSALESLLQGEEASAGNLPIAEADEGEDASNDSEVNVEPTASAANDQPASKREVAADANNELPKTGTAIHSIGAGVTALLSGLGLGFIDRKRRRK